MLYPYYWPHFKSGGPVQSLYNLVGIISKQVDLYLISKDRDIAALTSDKSVQPGTWNMGPSNERIFYTRTISLILIFRLIRNIRPDVVMINGLFNLSTTINGLLVCRLLGIKFIISPRGMLQGWALRRNELVKKVFLKVLKLGLKKNEIWHATDEQEKADIIRHFGSSQIIHVSANIPRSLGIFSETKFPSAEGKIKLVFLSLINSNKNLHLIIEEVNQLSEFTLDIYGPSSDETYWELCKSKIIDISRIIYHGPIPPWKVTDMLVKFHFFVLPTDGENFGHAIFDALASGIPVIISKNTPWQGIDSKKAGYYLNSNDSESLRYVLRDIVNLSSSDYSSMRKASFDYARNYLSERDFRREYSFLLD